MNRRDFVQTAVAGTLASSASRRSRTAAGPRPNKYESDAA
jgi:hypothetical protein